MAEPKFRTGGIVTGGGVLAALDTGCVFPRVTYSQVLAPEDARVWIDWTRAVDLAIENLRPPKSHTCTDACRPYRGPILQGRRGETITPGRTT